MTLQTLQRAAGYAGMAKDLLAARLTNSEQTRERAQQHLAQRMGQLRGLRARLKQRCEEAGRELLLAEAAYCTDNAGMIAFTAVQRFLRGDRSPLEAEVDPNLPLVRAA